jgi:Ca-activated chloride channel homolog
VSLGPCIGRIGRIGRIRPILSLLLLAALPAAAQLPPRVVILNPPAAEPIFGGIEIVLDVEPGGAPVERVEVFFDNVRVGVLERPPWRIVVNAGQENAPHHIEVIAHGANGAAATAEVRTPRLQVDDEIDVSLQQLFVTVESRGHRAGGVRREDFTILDEGVPQSIATFETGDIPFTAVLLLDASSSMAGNRLRTAVDGARSFVQSMNRLDEAKVILFSDQIRKETPFTSVPSILTLGLGDVAAGGGTALNDAFYLGLKRLEGRLGRKVLILLSDGIDVESVLPMEQVRAIARRNQAVVYWLWLRREGETDDPLAGPLYISAWRDAAGHAEERSQLRATVLESGGRVEPLDSIDQLRGKLDSILHELRDQYVLGYSPSVHRGPGTWHKVELRLQGGGAFSVRTQEGYTEK